jgi:hypothetical protein
MVVSAGSAKSYKDMEDQTVYEKTLENKCPAASFLEQYETLMSSNISEPKKAVIQELYREIGYLGEIVSFGVFNSSGKTNTHYFDAVTGASYPLPEVESSFDVFYDYQPVELTHLDSALICTTGEYSDTGTKCK